MEQICLVSLTGVLPKNAGVNSDGHCDSRLSLNQGRNVGLAGLNQRFPNRVRCGLLASASHAPVLKIQACLAAAAGLTTGWTRRSALEQEPQCE